MSKENLKIENKIPKILHYCWFGGKAKPKLVLDCLESWKRVMPDYQIIEWNESNFNVNSFEYTKKAYQEKKWAFVSDVARLVALEKMGGIYLDTDMYILKSFNDFLDYDLVLGKEDERYISAGMVGADKNNLYIKKVLEYYKESHDYETIPRVLTNIYKQEKELLERSGLKIKIFDPVFFYPFTADNIKRFNYHNATIESYAVHLWNYSWGKPLNKFIKKIGLHKTLKKISEKIGIKKILKKILKIT